MSSSRESLRFISHHHRHAHPPPSTRASKGCGRCARRTIRASSQVRTSNNISKWLQISLRAPLSARFIKEVIVKRGESPLVVLSRLLLHRNGGNGRLCQDNGFVVAALVCTHPL